MKDVGFDMETILQKKEVLSNPMKILEADLRAKLVNYNNSPILKWCLGNKYFCMIYFFLSPFFIINNVAQVKSVVSDKSTPPSAILFSSSFISNVAGLKNTK